MLLVFLVSIDIKANADSIAWKRPSENSSILCGSNNGVYTVNSQYRASFLAP